MKSLSERIAELPKDAPVTDVFRVISEWEPEAIAESLKQEKTTKSGYLKPLIFVEAKE